MNRYEKYKDSGVEWIGEIPSHWEVKRSKWLFTQRNLRGFTDEPLLSVTQDKSLIRRDENDIRVWNPTSDISGYKLVVEGDFVISLRSFEGGIEYSKVRGIVSPAYSVFDSISNENDDFLRLLFKTNDFINELNTLTTGIRQGKNIGYDDFSSVFLPLPPLPEQHQIVSFLDEKTSLIDDLINKKEQKIGLLKEYRTSLINRVITKGLNPDCPMKDSGVEWIGMIPSHWDVSGVRYELEFHDNKRIPLSSEERDLRRGEYRYYGSTGVIDHVDDYLFDGEYILIGEDGSNLRLRNHPLSQVVDGQFWVNNHSHILKSRYGSNHYYSHLLELTDYTIFITGSTQPKLTMDKLKEVPLVNPPLSEQEQIVSFLDEKTSEIDRTIQSEQKKIELLKEYRQSLISSVITGKIKVVN